MNIITLTGILQYAPEEVRHQPPMRQPSVAGSSASSLDEQSATLTSNTSDNNTIVQVP